MKVLKKQLSSHNCIICGMDNPFGLKAQFYEVQEDKVISKFCFSEHHQSYPGRTHGGMICAMLDELVGRAIWIKDPNMWGVTMTINIKYRKPVPLETMLYAEGKIEAETSRSFSGVGYIKDMDGTILAEAEATYIKLPLSKITQDLSEHNEMFLLPDNVKEI